MLCTVDNSSTGEQLQYLALWITYHVPRVFSVPLILVRLYAEIIISGREKTRRKAPWKVWMMLARAAPERSKGTRPPVLFTKAVRGHRGIGDQGKYLCLQKANDRCAWR
jgi:hypothetical protein